MFSRSAPIPEDYACESQGPDRGCVFKDEQEATTADSQGGKLYFGRSRYTGMQCDGGTDPLVPGSAPLEEKPTTPTEPTQAERCAWGNGPPLCAATVNGQAVCVSCSSTTTTTNDTTTTPAGAGAAPSGITAGTKSTTTTCNGDACETTTTYKNSAGVVTGTVTSTGAGVTGTTGSGSGGGLGEGDTLCDLYPDVAACKVGSFSGTCAAGAAAITCEGDAVQCSMAREQYKRQCEFFEKTGDETTAANQAKQDGVAGATDHPNRNPETQALGTFDQTDIIGGSCPADRVLGAGVIGVTIPFSQLCSPAEKLGILLVAWTAVACLGIVFKGT